LFRVSLASEIETGMRRRLTSWLVSMKRRLMALLMGRRFRPRVLVYCGVHKGWAFGRRLHHFDRAIGFEPIPELFEELQSRFRRDRRVTLVNAALAAEEGKAKFYVHDVAPASSLSVLGPGYQKRHGRAISVAREIEVQCVNLGKWLAERGITDIDTLVTDIQGHDLAALKTCGKLVSNRRIRLIRCEVERDDVPPSYENAPSDKRADFDAFLGEDYEVLRIDNESSGSFDDVTWVRRGENDRWWCF
jgi:FkbM family methyltransferase